MAGSEQIITLHPDTIRDWVQARGGEPVKKRGTGHSSMDPAVLDIAFPGKADASVEPIGWEEWLTHLDEQELAAVMQGEGADSMIKIMRKDRVVMSGEGSTGGRPSA
ncbi:MAG TPA: hypothetical protein VGV90_17995 [Solirubrobacteraceae bacterium]|nr:hypothetical protein [Solirubrobacteraceae bacterium]